MELQGIVLDGESLSHPDAGPLDVVRYEVLPRAANGSIVELPPEARLMVLRVDQGTGGPHFAAANAALHAYAEHIDEYDPEMAKRIREFCKRSELVEEMVAGDE